MSDAISPAVRAVCLRYDAANDLVMDHIYSFVDVSVYWNVTMAALCGHLRLVKRLSARHPRAFDLCCTEAMDSAAEFGHLEIVQWLHVNRTEGCTKDAMTMAAGNGHLAIVQWLHVNRREGCTKSAMDFAAHHGHLHVVQWLHANRKEGCTRSAMDNAAKDGQLRVIQWLHAHRQEGCSKSAFANACTEGHRDVAQWLLTHRRRNCNIADGMEKACAYGRPAIVQWLHDAIKAMPWDDSFCEDQDEDDDEDDYEENETQWWVHEMREDAGAVGGDPQASSSWRCALVL